MAYSSFTLRKQTVNNGSYTRGTLDDTAIRSDGLVTSGFASAGENSFSANLISEGVVLLEWGLEKALVNKSQITTGVEPTELVIRYSARGEPVTPNEGVRVVTIDDQTPYTSFQHEPEVNQGRWVYYSLFVKYSNGTDDWYERLATLYIQIATQYQSTNSLWKRIPQYYRELDYRLPVLSVSEQTPLYTFLDLFGDEIDRTRTLIDSVSLSNDPEIAVTPALRELARETGLEINIEDLGTAKVRSLIGNIGTLRRTKGTIGNISSYISALTGCRVEYEYKSGDPKPHIFHVYAQRTNFVADPEFNTIITSTSQGTVNNGTTTYNATFYQAASSWGIYTYGSDSMGASATVVNTNDGIRVTLPSGTYASRTVLIYGRKTYPYVENVVYGTSFDYSASAGSAGASFNNFHTALNTTKASWESGVGSGSMPAQMYYDTAWNTGASFAAGNTSTRYSLDYSNNTGASATATVVPVLEFTMSPGSSIFVANWLVENAVGGSYFSGNTREGGYIPIKDGTSGSGSFDYFWENGNTNNAYSFFVNDRERSVKTTERVLEEYVVPVTMLDYYQLDWNYYPGK